MVKNCYMALKTVTKSHFLAKMENLIKVHQESNRSFLAGGLCNHENMVFLKMAVGLLAVMA